MSLCPVCKQSLDHLDDYTYEGGDITLCFFCGEVVVVCDDLSLRSMLNDEFMEMPEGFQTFVRACQAGVRQRVAGHA